MLTSYNGQTITYDAIGNHLSYRDGISLTWQNGREFATFSQTNGASVSYTYDASGMLLGVTTSSGSQFTAKYAPAVLNPLRYRGYVYDTETGLYYLQSRYENGSHYHVMMVEWDNKHHGDHWEPGSYVPEPWNTTFFGG